MKSRCEFARIKIHLKNDRKEDVVTRIFTVQGKSTWMLNGSTVNIKQIQEFTASLNIQVCRITNYYTYIYILCLA